jgi:AcrR family transcriptional regulator
MSSKKNETKKKLLTATVNLLEVVENPEDITIRKIAETAGVGVGLINYYYESRDQLIHEAISSRMGSVATVMENIEEDVIDPVKYLKEMLITMADIGIKDSKMNKYSAEYELVKGDFSLCLYLLPILRRIFNEKKTEVELRLLAIQIIVAFQSIYLRQEAFHMFTGLDIENRCDRELAINMIINNLV